MAGLTGSTGPTGITTRRRKIMATIVTQFYTQFYTSRAGKIALVTMDNGAD